MFIAGHVLQGLTTSLLLIAAVPPLALGFGAEKLRYTSVTMSICIFGAVALGPTAGGIQANADQWRPLVEPVLRAQFELLDGDTLGEVIASVFARKNPQALPGEIDAERRRLTDAPLVIGVVSFTKPHPKVPPWEQELSAGASAMNIVTAASALGYGACWLTGWFAFDRDVLDGLGLKPDEKFAGFIHIGTPLKPSEDRPRPALADIVTRF